MTNNPNKETGMSNNTKSRRGMLTGLAATGAAVILPRGQVEAAMAAFTDEFGNFNTNRWLKREGANGGEFNTGFTASNVTVVDGKLRLLLNDTPSYNKPYSSGEVKTKQRARYGTFVWGMRAPPVPGTVFGGFTWAPNGDEIDFEFLGRDTTEIHLTYHINGIGHNKVVPLGFNAASAFHNYKFIWLPNSITWFVDDRQVHKVTGTSSTLPSAESQIFANYWTGAPNWAGPFTYTGQSVARIDSISYKPVSV